MPPLAGGTATAGFLVAMNVILFVALAAIYGRGISHAALFVSDTFVFFDGIHRILKGQSPNADFWSPVGPIPYLLPYFGYRITGTFSGAVEMGSLLLAAPTLTIASVLLWRRTSPVMALLILGTIAAVIVVPLVPGQGANQISHAMHYNRWGWGLLVALFLLGLPGGNGRRWAFLAAVLCGGLLVGLFLTKITYFLVAVAYLALLATLPGNGRSNALIALVTGAALLTVITLFSTGVIFGYVHSIQEALRSDSAVRGSYFDVAFSNRDNIGILILATYAVLLRPGLSWRSLVLVGFIMVSGVAIIDQNYQFKFIVSLPVAFAILSASAAADASDRFRIASIIVASAYLVVAPYATDWARVTLQHVRAPTGQLPGIQDPRFDNLYIYNSATDIADSQAADSSVDLYDGPYDMTSLLDGKIPISHLTRTEFLPVLEEGARLLKSLGADKSEITTLDFVNTMPLMVDAPRKSRGYSWMHFGRNMSDDTLPEGAEMFKDVSYIAVPLKSATHPSVYRLLSHYGDYLTANTLVAGHSKNWVVLRHEPGAKG